MSENPDNKIYEGLGPQYKQGDTTLDGRYLIPSTGMMRWYQAGPTQQMKLQRYEWSSEEGKHDWYDVATVSE